MRDIRFKAKRLDNGEWVESFSIDRNKDGRLYLKKYSIDGTSWHGWVEVDPATVCQFTGLKDTDGNEIWEGDQLKIRNDWNDSEWETTVRFRNGVFEVDTEHTDYNVTPLGYIDEEWIVERISNIHDKTPTL